LSLKSKVLEKVCTNLKDLSETQFRGEKFFAPLFSEKWAGFGVEPQRPNKKAFLFA